MSRIEYLIYKKLGNQDIDVLKDTSANTGHSYVTLGNNHSWFDELSQDATNWVDLGSVGTRTTELEMAAVPGQEGAFPARTLHINRQGGQRQGEIKLTYQRDPDTGISTWKEPVREDPPPAWQAFAFLLRDELGKIHARYVASLDKLPKQLSARIQGMPGNVGVLNLAEEGGVVLQNRLLARILDTLRNRYNVILYGPPGTGKTWLMTEVHKVFCEGISSVYFDPGDLEEPFKATEVESLTDKENRSSEFVIFHQSTSYESFVAGLRPMISNGELTYDVEAGPLLELAEHAIRDDSASLLLIDEINRGNTAEVFGELITVLEPDKRLNENGSEEPYKTIAARLPYAPDGLTVITEGRFRMPLPFYTLASMNSVDRTVAPLDTALRRRFQIIEVPPDLELLRQRFFAIGEQFTEAERVVWSHLSWLAHQLLDRINDLIAITRGPDFQLGHSYVLSVFDEEAHTLREREQRLLDAFGNAIIPQLKELFRDQPEELYVILGGEASQARGLFELHTELDTAPDIVMEALGWLEFKPFPVDGDVEHSLEILRIIAGVEPNEGWPEWPSEEPDTTAEPFEEGEADQPNETPG